MVLNGGNSPGGMSSQSIFSADRLGESPKGAERVLALLILLANEPAGSTLDQLAKLVNAPRSTVHRSLASLVKAGLATSPRYGKYELSDEFLRLAFTYAEARPINRLVEPILEDLVARFGETAHYAILEGTQVIYRAKADPRGRSVKLTSVIGGANPAHCTAVGKLLLARKAETLADLKAIVGQRTFEARTEHTITSVSALWDELQEIKRFGYALDREENEPGINCIAVPLAIRGIDRTPGAISISALAFRTPLETLIQNVDSIREIISSH